MTLKLTTYQPRYTDPRVQKKVEAVLRWCKLHLHSTRPHNVHHNELIAIFGPSGNSLSAFLRANLLQKVGKYVVGESSYGYLLNEAGYKKVELQAHTANGEYKSPADLPKFHKDLETLEFNYTLKSDRYWHPLQNIRREQKDAFWVEQGLPFDYDIEACAPTVLIQLATRFGLLAYFAKPITDYLANKDEFRAHVAKVADCSIPTAKRIINSLFNGARLSRNYRCSAFKALDCNYDAMTRLQEDPQVKALRHAVKLMWQRIQANTQLDLKKSSAKWSVYFKFERAFIQIIQLECVKQGAKVFTEHDGFRTSKKIDKETILEVIKKKTNFVLKIDGPK